jgi:hypothetical protein
MPIYWFSSAQQQSLLTGEMASSGAAMKRNPLPWHSRDVSSTQCTHIDKFVDCFM